MPDHRSYHHSVATARIAVDDHTSGFLIDPSGRMALMHRGQGVAASPTAEEAAEMIRGLLSIIPMLEARDAEAGDTALAELEAITDARH